MAKELEEDIKDYSQNSGLSEDLVSKDSVLNDPRFTEYQDAVEFDQQIEGIFPNNMPLGSGSAVSSGTNFAPLVYQMQSRGVFTFGDASDGNVTISGNTTLTSDKYYDTLIVNNGVTLNPGGYRIFVANTLHLYGTIARNGTNGSNASGQTGGAGGTALADGYLKGSLAVGAGING